MFLIEYKVCHISLFTRFLRNFDKIFLKISKQNQHTKSCISAPHNSTVQQLHNLNEKLSLNGSSLSSGHGFSISAEDKFLTRHAFSQNSPYHPTRLDEYTMSNRITNG